jgi:hypothetical protein
MWNVQFLRGDEASRSCHDRCGHGQWASHRLSGRRHVARVTQRHVPGAVERHVKVSMNGDPRGIPVRGGWLVNSGAETDTIQGCGAECRKRLKTEIEIFSLLFR